MVSSLINSPNNSPNKSAIARGLYLVTPDWDDTARLLQATEQALQGGVVLLQYRHKRADSVLAETQAAALLALCRRYRVPLIINDNVALCLALDADGVHVGGSDAAVAAVRAAVGSAKIVGASCYGSLPLAAAAARDGADYLAFGGFYPSTVKQYEVGTAPTLLTAVRQLTALPLVVIGGMDACNAAPLVAHGADLVAAISSVYDSADPQAAAGAFAALF